jgi:hypothetical protein
MKPDNPLISHTPSSAFEIQEGYLLDNNLAYDKKLPPKAAKRTISEILKD